MGALTPVASGLNSITSTIGAVNALNSAIGNIGRTGSASMDAQQDLAMKQLKAQQQAAMKTAQEQANLSAAQIAATAASNETARRTALKRAVSRQRAQFGSQNVSDGGSSEAVLLGMFAESDTEREDRERIDGLRLAALDQDLAAQSRLNILQRAQLQERQKLQKALYG